MKNAKLSGVRAVICDVYGTLLEVGPPPLDADQVWLETCRRITGKAVPLFEFNMRCHKIVQKMNDDRRRAGEPYPDACWLDVIAGAFDPLLDSSLGPELADWHSRCVRTCTAMPGAVATLEALQARGIRLGFASNAQDYTVDELHRAGVPIAYFDLALWFFSGNEGFAKPSRRVFTTLNQKLAALDISPRETLMVGDSLENDIQPAAAAGWQTWHIGPRTWEQLRTALLAGC